MVNTRSTVRDFTLLARAEPDLVRQLGVVLFAWHAQPEKLVLLDEGKGTVVVRMRVSGDEPFHRTLRAELSALEAVQMVELSEETT